MYLCSTQPKWYTFRLLSGILLRYHLHCWIEQQPQTEGITDEDAITEVQAVPVLIQTQGNTITVEGAEAGTEIILYGANGVQLDSVIATTGVASLNASGLSGSVAIVKIGNKTVKVLIKQ